MEKARTSLMIVVVLGLSVLCSSALAVDGNEPIAHWKFDEGSGTTAYDSAGDNNGTIYGAQWTTGQIDGALEFDGVDDYVDVGDPVDESLDFGADDSFTLLAWIKSDKAKRYSAIVDKRRSTGTGGVFKEGYNLGVHLGVIEFGVEDVSGNRTSILHSGATVLNDDTWHHVVAVRDTQTGELRAYVNGFADAPAVTDSTTATLATSKSFQIGRRDTTAHGSNLNYFGGKIDDVRVYDRALSAEEVQELYLLGLPAHERAIIIMEDVLAEKEEALDASLVRIAKEWLAYDALEELLASGDYGDLKKGDIVTAKQKIHSAMQHQEQSIDTLEKSIEKLCDALAALGWEPEPNLPEP